MKKSRGGDVKLRAVPRRGAGVGKKVGDEEKHQTDCTINKSDNEVTKKNFKRVTVNTWNEMGTRRD